ncbi:hypothetical protein PQX77_019444 [Marasmius sp. AFHP31]|nr:hypothetical protein PQX77_019444 [Marasmius sp. AFHP31]
MSWTGISAISPTHTSPTPEYTVSTNTWRPADLLDATAVVLQATSGNKTTISDSGTIGGIVGAAIALVLILGIAIRVCMREWTQKSRDRRQRRRTQNFTVTALPQIMMAGSGNPNYPRKVGEKKKNRGVRHSGPPPPTVDDQRAGRADSEMLAKLNMIMERVARLEEADRERDREEAPPDYTSNRS